MVNVAAPAVRSSKFVPIRGHDGARPRLLLAEDSKAARLLTAALLTRLGCDVDAVEHGQDAVEQAQGARYDLIMLDIEMPILDGVSAAKQIRAIGGEVGRTPLMALSAFLADSDTSASWRNAFDHALPKPAGRDELRAAIQAILDQRSQSFCRLPLPVPPALTTDPLVDWAVAGEIQAQLAAGQWLEIIMTAEVEIIAAIMAMRADAAHSARRAHKIKGIAASFGLLRLASEARRLEAEEVCEKDRLVCAADELMRIAVKSTDCLREQKISGGVPRYG